MDEDSRQSDSKDKELDSDQEEMVKISGNDNYKRE